MAHCSSAAEDIHRADADIKGMTPTVFVCWRCDVMWVKLDICIENRMNASALLDIWTRVMFFKFSNLHECNLRELHKCTHNAQAIIRFLYYYYL